MLAIVHNLKVDHKVTAICTVRTYDVWGNAKDGYEVNDIARSERGVEFPMEVTVSNFPRFPGAKDEHRSFPDDVTGFSCNVCVGFDIPDKTLKEILEIRCKIEMEHDGGKTYYIYRKRDRYPICEVEITKFKE